MSPDAYERDPYLTTLESRIVARGEEGGRPWVTVADALFYPEGGGQPSDRGTLNGVAVEDAQKRQGRVRLMLAAPVPGETVLQELDWARRFDHMQQHTGQHLLTALAQDRFGWATTAFHLGASVCDIEVEAGPILPRDLQALEEAVAAEIRAHRPVSARWVTPEAYGQASVRSRGLPEGHEGDIRLVEIAGVDLNTCGGTHLRHTGELETLKLLGTEAIRGGTRLFYVAGGRVRRRLEAHEARNAELRARVGAPDEDLVPALQAKLDQLLTLERRSRKLEDRLAEVQAATLAAAPEALVEAHLEDGDMAFLQKLARQVLQASPGKALFLTAEAKGQGLFLLSAGEASRLDVPRLGRGLAEILGAKGGGSGRIFQGKAPDLIHREAALNLLRSSGD